MRPLRTRLEEARDRTGTPWEVLERDYLLSWVLAGVFRTDALRDGLAFKGGTALKKCYFGDTRFSEDLDFSATGAIPRGNDLREHLDRACETAARLLDEYAPVRIACDRYTERDPHPGGQEAFAVRARLPWHRELHTRVMVEITVDEPVLRPVASRPLLHAYGEPIDVRVPVYALEEIVAEKLRAILQHRDRLQRRGWGRSRARDYYDLWRILGTYRDRMDLADFASLLEKKCAVRDVGFSRPEDFFEETMLDHVEDTWRQWLGPLVSDLPPLKRVIGDLRRQVADLLA